MNKKRSGSMSASDNSADVSAKNKSRSSLYDFFNAAGTSSIEFMRSICRIFLNASRFIGLEILNVIKNILKLLIHILTLPVDAFKERMKVTRKMQQSLRKAEKKGKKSFILELVKCAGSFLFGEKRSLLYCIQLHSAYYFCRIFNRRNILWLRSGIRNLRGIQWGRSWCHCC